MNGGGGLEANHPAAGTPPEPTRTPTAPDARAIGRDAELARLAELYEEARTQGERLALVEGPQGVGKAQILQALAGRIRLDGGVVLEGRCEPGRAFGPFGEIVERALRFLDEINHRTGIDLRALACRAECHRFWYQHAGDQPGQGADGRAAARPRMLEGAQAEEAALEQRLRFFDAVHGLLQDVARVRPPVILIHGLERADGGTLELLRFLLDGAGPASHGVDTGRSLPALFVASRRVAPTDGPVHDVLATIATHRATRQVPVSTLDARGVRQYLQNPDAVARVLERTGGVPERIDLLLEADPLTPEAALARRLDDLGIGARRLVESLAVIGQPAEIELLAAVAGGDEPLDGPARSEFSRCDLLARNIVDGSLVFRFAREADRERAYALLDPDIRTALHRRAVDAFAAGSPAQPEAAVRHALLAGDAAGAAPYLLDAAQSLEARYAHSEAAKLLEDALGQMPGDQETEPFQDHLVDLYRVLGDYRKALVHATRVAEAHPGSPRAALRLGQLLTLSGRLGEGVTALVSARELAGQAGDPEAVWEAEALLAEAHYQRGDYAEARRWADRALGASEGETLLLELHARNTLGKLHLAQRDPRTAAALFDENRFKAARAGLGRQEAQALTNVGVALLRQQRLDEAQQAFERAIEVAEQANDTRERAISTENLAVLAHLRREYARAQVLYHEAVSLLKRLGNRPMLARVAYNLGQLYVRLGERSRARTLCDFAAHVGGSSLPPAIAGEGMVLRGRLEAACGDTQAARTAFVRAKEIFHELRESSEVEADVELAKTHLADGDVEQADEIVAQLPERHPPKREAEVALLRTDLARAAGRPTLALARRAAGMADEIGDPELQLPALLRVSRALLDAEDLAGASRALERAQSIEADLTEHVPEDALTAWASRPVRAELASVEARVSQTWRRAPGDVPAGASTPVPHPAPTTTTSASPSAGAGGAGSDWTSWKTRFPSIVGRSDALAQVLTIVDKVAPTGATVLLRGESGTGKELVADALHRASPRAERPFVKVNCAALVETLLLSELFGHERGAFTGAQSRRKGRFELADGGTIFLDEIGDISPKTQVALLRVLQEREFERVGGTQPIKVDVRIIAATNRDLEAMVADGDFREDLYYRLRGVVIDLPALRNRPTDIGPLAHALLRRIAEERHEPAKQLADDALTLLGEHTWPGNVRELENVLRSATLFADGTVLRAADFTAFGDLFQRRGGDPEPETAGPRRSSPTTAPAPANGADDGAEALPDAAPAGRGEPVESRIYDQIRAGNHSLFEMKKVLERECIVRALRETGGNITQAAGLLGMKRPRLSQLVKQYGLNDENGAAS